MEERKGMPANSKREDGGRRIVTGRTIDSTMRRKM